MSTVAAHLFATPHHAHENANGVDVDDVAQVPSINLSKKDEDSLLKLMSECDYATTNVEKFIEKLQSELNNLETVCFNANFLFVLTFSKYFFQVKR